MAQLNASIQDNPIHSTHHGDVNEDYLMSDVSSSSDEIEESTVLDKTSLTEHSNRNLAIDRFISRPVSAGNDIGFGFCIAPKNTVKRIGLAKNLPQISLSNPPNRLDEQTTSTAATCSSSLQDVAGVHPKLSSTTSDNTAMVDLPLSLAQHVKQTSIQLPQSKPDHFGEDGDNTSRSQEALQNPQPPAHSSGGSNADDNCLLRNTEELTAPPENLNQAERTPIHTVNQHASRGAPLACGQHEVQDSPSTHRNGVWTPCLSPVDPRTAPEAPEAITEEQIMLLLMHRSRKRANKAKKDIRYIQFLKSSNAKLEQDLQIMTENLESLRVERDEADAKLEVVHNEMDMFNDKYRKLKNWALEMNKEFDTIRQEGHHLRLSITSLKCQSQKIREPLQWTIKSNVDATADVANIKLQLKEMQQLLATQQVTVQDMNVVLAQKNAEIRVLKRKEQEHASLGANALKILDDLQTSAASQKNILVKSMAELSTKLQIVQPESNLKEDVGECLRILQEVSRQHPDTLTNLRNMNSTITAITEQISTLEKNLQIELQSQSEDTIFASLRKDVFTVTENIQNLKPSIVEFGMLLKNQTQDKARDLELQRQDYNKLVHDCENLRSIASRTNILEHESAEKDIVISKLRLGTKQFEQIQTEFEHMKRECELKDAAIAELRVCLATVEELTNERVSVEQSKRVEYERSVRDYQNEIAAQQIELASLSEQARLYNELKKINQEKDRDIHRLQLLLEDAQVATKTFQAADLRCKALEQQMIQVQANASKVEDLQQQLVELEKLNKARVEKLADQEQKLESLKQLEENLGVVRQQLAEKDSQVANKEKEIKKLKAQLTQTSQDDRPESSDLNEMFTQNTVLSIPAHANPADQQPELQSDPSNHIGGVRDEDRPETIEPSLTMKVVNYDQGATIHQTDTGILSQVTIVPDSQVQPDGRASDSPHTRSYVTDNRRQRTSSPLSDIDEDLLETDPEIDLQDLAVDLYHKNSSEFASDLDDHVFDVVEVSPQNTVRYNAQKNLTRRPSSVASQESMLLQASEIGYANNNRKCNVQNAHLGAVGNARRRMSSTRSGELRQVQSTTRSYSTDRGSRGNMHTFNPVCTDSRSQANSNNHRELVQPNSAAKRSNDQYNAADIQESRASKRFKLSKRRSDSGVLDQQQQISANDAPDLSVDGLSNGTRSGNIAAESQSSFKKPMKKSQSVRTRSKQDKYADRFGGSSQL